MPTMEHKGVKLAYEEKGSGSPTFLFVHGWTCDRSFFKPQADHWTCAATARATSRAAPTRSRPTWTTSRT
jgi:pimeloyl-ACP methyl ester carboxylesterase